MLDKAGIRSHDSMQESTSQKKMPVKKTSIGAMQVANEQPTKPMTKVGLESLWQQALMNI